MKRPLLAAFALLLPMAGTSQGSPGEFIVLKDKALLMGSPVSLCGTTVIQSAWRPDGRAILTLRADMPKAAHIVNFLRGNYSRPDSKMQVLLVDIDTGSSQTILSTSARDGFLSGLQWIPNSSLAFIQFSSLPQEGAEGKESLYLLNGTRLSKFQPWEKEGEAHKFVMVSPVADAAVSMIVSRDNQKTTVQAHLIRGDGSYLEVPFPNVAHTPDVYWSKDGRQLYCLTYDVADKSETPRELWFKISLDGAAPAPITKPSDAIKRAEGSSNPFGLSFHVREVRNEDVAQPVSTLWAESPNLEMPALLAANSKWGEISPAGNKIAYEAEGALFMRELIPVDKALYEQTRLQKLRSEAILRAKMVATAALQSALDNNNLLPTPGEFKDKLSKYVRDQATFKDFVYTFPGGDVSKIQRSEVELGYVALPGGRAVTYLDGHVKCIPNK